MFPQSAVTVFDASVLEAIDSHASGHADSEVCGLIVQNKAGAIEVVESANVAEDSKTTFTIDPKLHAAYQQAGKILAVYHSHWSNEQPAMLGFDDVRFSKRSSIPYLLFHAIDRTFDYYDPHDLNPFPLQQRNGTPQSIEFYLGWQWAWGRADCYVLMRNYFKGMLSIELPDHERASEPKRQFTSKYKLFLEALPEMGFTQLPINTKQQNNDVLLLHDTSGHPVHVGVVVDAEKGYFIHHWDNTRLSSQDVWGESWRDNAHSIFRWKDLN